MNNSFHHLNNNGDEADGTVVRGEDVYRVGNEKINLYCFSSNSG